MSAVPQDDDLEARIDREYERVCRAAPAERSEAWIEFCRLVNSRSPERVAEMEAEWGLR